MANHTSTVKFLKFDAYGNPTFSSTKDVDEKSYDVFKSAGTKLEGMFPYAFNPIYHSPQYDSVSVRFDKDDSLLKRLKKNGVYRVKWSAKTRQKQSSGERFAILRLLEKPVLIRVDEVAEEELLL